MERRIRQSSTMKRRFIDSKTFYADVNFYSEAITFHVNVTIYHNISQCFLTIHSSTRVRNLRAGELEAEPWMLLSKLPLIIARS